jgi:dihydroorotate dehydrogenase electron transfer subunit
MLRVDPPVTSPSPFRVHETSLAVKANTPVNDEYRLLVLDAPRALLELCRPGQFFNLLCPQAGGETPYLRPMSIYGFYPEAGELHFLYKVTGAGTRALATLGAGDALDVVGPLGEPFTIADDWRNLVLVARGVGLATLAPLAIEANRLGRRLTAICSARHADYLMSTEHFERLGAHVIPVTDTDGSSSLEHLEALITDLIAQGRADAFYTCGSNRLLKLLQRIGETHGVPGQIALEQQMACGLGMCQCCVRPLKRDGATHYLRVCREGPVFDIAEVVA